MNYRHAFHAGNFADLVKHAALIALLDELLGDARPLTIVDTHAGAGLYDLTDEAQVRSKEAEAGVRRLMQVEARPAALGPLAAAVAARNPGGEVAVYPGSPALVLERLRPQDRLIACELEPGVRESLVDVLAASGRPAEARLADGFDAAREVARAAPARLLVLIDPPFERADDYQRTAEAAAAVLRAAPKAALLIWLPLKDLETLDAFVRRLEAFGVGGGLVSETRIRPLHDPMRMNGCALVAIGTPPVFERKLRAISEAVAAMLGEPGAAAKLWRIG